MRAHTNFAERIGIEVPTCTRIECFAVDGQPFTALIAAGTPSWCPRVSWSGLFFLCSAVSPSCFLDISSECSAEELPDHQQQLQTSTLPCILPATQTLASKILKQ